MCYALGYKVGHKIAFEGMGIDLEMNSIIKLANQTMSLTCTNIVCLHMSCLHIICCVHRNTVYVYIDLNLIHV